MNREQAKIRCKLSKEEWEALGEAGLAKWYEVMEHFGNGGDVEGSSMGAWVVCEDPRFELFFSYRIKPRIHIVNGFEVPAPIKEYTGQERVYRPNFCTYDWAESEYTKSIKMRLIKRGAAFGTLEAARANSLAMVGIDPSTYKE